MALYALRLRRAIPLSSSLLSHTLYKPNLNRSTFQTNSASEFHRFDSLFQSRLFRSSTVSLSSRSRSFDRNAADDEIGPDTILFEGCDYEHWLITVDFPKDVQLTREEKIETYIQTAAKVFGSVEEAKKKIYALSTTTYEGFQVLCSEDTSKKFEGLPGVVFVLPDSYIDPVNKEYGGDKYINGEIIERPPPPQFRRESRPPRRGPQYQRSNYGPPQQNYGAPPPQQNYGAPPPQQNYAPSQQNYGAPQGSPPQQNYGAPQGFPPQQNLGALQSPPPQQNYGTPQGSPSQQNYGAPQGPPPKQNSGPPRHQNYGPQQYPLPPQENRPPQQNYGHPLQSYGAPQQSFSPQQNYGPQGDHRGPTPLGSSQGGWGSSPQGDRQGSRPPYQENYNRAEQGNYFPQRDNQQYAPPQRGSYGQGPIGGQVQGTGPTFGLNNPRQGEDQGFPQMEQTGNTIMQGGEQRTFATNEMDQGRY